MIPRNLLGFTGFCWVCMLLVLVWLQLVFVTADANWNSVWKQERRKVQKSSLFLSAGVIHFDGFMRWVFVFFLVLALDFGGEIDGFCSFEWSFRLLISFFFSGYFIWIGRFEICYHFFFPVMEKWLAFGVLGEIREGAAFFLIIFSFLSFLIFYCLLWQNIVFYFSWVSNKLMVFRAWEENSLPFTCWVVFPCIYLVGFFMLSFLFQLEH